MNAKVYEVGLAGNPNSGKTTLFNALTGSNHQVGNWAGVTVEKKEGRFSFTGKQVHLVDMPGTYSLSPYSLEERVASSYLVEATPDVIINIVDASSLERNLYLSIQLMEMKVPMVVALNMMDEAERKGIKVDIGKLSERLGVPVVPITAVKSEGLDKLIGTVLDVAEGKILTKPSEVDYGQSLEMKMAAVGDAIDGCEYHGMPSRWVALKVMENDEAVVADIGRHRTIPVGLTCDDGTCDDMTVEIANARYLWIEALLRQCATIPDTGYDQFSDKVDRLLLNKYVGIPVFMAVMFMVFQLTFSLGGVFADILDVFFNETLAEGLSALLVAVQVAPWMQSLVIDGILGGVGGILTFVPNIAIMFLLISVLEDSGYMARAALLMDRVMTAVGLNGRHFIPLIIGFGCNVPGIMSTRTLEDPRERMIAILINPFMSCSARLPVYVLFSSVFFPGVESVVTFSLYLLGIFIALLAALVLRHTVLKTERQPFIMELPPYRFPSVKSLGLHVWDKVQGYLVKAGTVILGASVFLWFVLNFNMTGMSDLTSSFGASIGRIFAPLLSPMGSGTWQAALSLLAGVAAKEIVVANMLIVYGLEDTATAAQLGTVLAGVFSQLSAYAFMVFVLLYTPCVGVIGVIRRETGSWGWTWFSVFYQLFVAWGVAVVIYQVGRLMGLS